jgi:membrane-anchored protein YejM (alkaline phosphatase superfamily)
MIMTKRNDRHNRITQWLRWGARVWSFPIIAYALLMASGYTWNWVTTGVADPYAVEDVSFIETLPPIFMFLSVVGLGIAWRWERLGGTITVVFQLAALAVLLIDRPITHAFTHDFPHSAIPYLMSMVVTIPGVVFLICGGRSRKGANPNDTA